MFCSVYSYIVIYRYSKYLKVFNYAYIYAYCVLYYRIKTLMLSVNNLNNTVNKDINQQIVCMLEHAEHFLFLIDVSNIA